MLPLNLWLVDLRESEIEFLLLGDLVLDEQSIFTLLLRVFDGGIFTFFRLLLWDNDILNSCLLLLDLGSVIGGILLLFIHHCHLLLPLRVWKPLVFFGQCL